ncbi:MAG TPA: roadblock/LC7 domain-containing protein, partial [Trebonia sp.]
ALVDTSPYARSALLLSADGLAIVSHGLDAEHEDKLSALASGMCSMARNVGAVFSGSDHVRQVVTELDELMLFISTAGSNSVLAVLTSRDADAGLMGYEMTQMVKSVAPFLASQPRIRGAVTRYQAPELPQRLPPEGTG